jgi:hypothetical protein
MWMWITGYVGKEREDEAGVESDGRKTGSASLAEVGR